MYSFSFDNSPDYEKILQRMKYLPTRRNTVTDRILKKEN
jgi:hypothetical protein